MRIDVSKIIFLLLVISGINNFSVISQSSVLDDLPDHGFGFLERVRNNTEFSIGIGYDKHPTHDAMPEASVIRIKNLKTSKYFTVRKEGKNIIFKADASNAKDPATLFTVHHRISGNLQPWLGFSHPTANNNMMNIDPANKTIIFNKKDFLAEDAKTSHWEIKGDSIDRCFLVNRETAGPLAPYTGKLTLTQIIKEKGFENATALWALSYKEHDAEMARIAAQFQEQIQPKQQERDKLQQQINGQQARINTLTNEASRYPIGNVLYARDGNSAPARAVCFENQEFGQKQKWRVRDSTLRIFGGPSFFRLECVWYGGFFCVHPPEGHRHGNCSCDNWPGHPSGKSCERLVWTTWKLSNYSRNAPAAGQGAYEMIKFIDVASGEQIVTLDKMWAGRIVAIYSVHYDKFLTIHGASYAGNKPVGLKAVGSSRSEPWCQFRILRDGEYIGIQVVNPYQTEIDNFNNLKNRVSQINNEITSLEQQKNQALTACRQRALANVYKYSDGKWVTMSGLLHTLTIQSDLEAWGTQNTGRLWHYTNNKWVAIDIQKPIVYVSVSAKSDVWCVDKEQTMWVKSGTGFALGSREGLPDNVNIIQLSVRNANEVWGIGTNSALYKFDGTEWKKKSPPNINMLCISAAENGAVWAVDKDGKVWQFENQKNWKTIPCDALFKQIAVRNDKDVFGISLARDLWHWNGTKWDNWHGPWDAVTLASGITEIPAVTKEEFTQFEGASTQQTDGKPLALNDDARIKFEIVKLGMGGGIPPQSAGDYVKIPVTKNPKVSGFAKDIIENFDISSLLKVSPLLTRGTAWLETSLKTPGKTSISFLARPRSSGDIQVVFGQSISDSYVWRVIIGGWKNTKSAIVKRRYEGNEAIDDVVCEVTKEQNPIAAAFPGNFTPYWVSIDDGLIIVGMGEIGENIFMTWRDQQPPADINQVGFASYKEPVEYTQIQLGAPIIAQSPQRLYFPAKGTTQKAQTINAPPAKGSFVWSPYPFRTSDDGALYFEIQGQDQAVLALSQEAQNNANHYAITWGDKNTKGKKGLSIKRWNSSVNAYTNLYFLNEETYPDIALNPQVKKQFWVSFNYGQIIIGKGNFGQHILLVAQDLSPLTSINTIGFGAFGTTAAQIHNIKVTHAITLALEKKSEAYKRSREIIAFKGSVVIILPFEYKFSQEGQSVKLDDLVNNKTYYPGATPQQGALYSFMFTVLPNGAPKMDWTKAPSNPQELKLQREIAKLSAAAELERLKKEVDLKGASIERETKEAEAQRIAAHGALERETAEARAQRLTTEGTISADLKKAEGDKARAQYEAQMGSARFMSETGVQVIGATASTGPIGAAIGVGIGGGLMAGGFAYGMLAESRLKDAAQKDFEGAQLRAQIARGAASVSEQGALAEISAKQKAALTTEQAALLEAQLKRKALERESSAAQLEFNAKLLQGEAQFAFRSHDSYVYVDQPERPQLGSASIPQDAIDNKKELVELLAQADATKATELDTLLTQCQNIIFKINHYYVISDNEIKQRIFRNLDKLFKAGQKNPESFPDVVNVFFSAYNNSFLVNEANPDEAVKKANWLRNINNLANNFLTSPSCEINSYFGEYVWHPQELSQPGVGSVTFEASGTNDLFICFTNDLKQQKTRNTNKEVYEIVIGGWDNNKAAIRIKSLGKSVKEVTYDDNEAAALNPNKPEKYWVNVNNGLISVGKGTLGQNTFLTWKDPYPINKLRYVGISSWNAPISIRNMHVSQGIALPPAPRSLHRAKIPKRVPVGTAKAVPSDSAEVAKLEGEEPDIEQEPEEAVKEEEAEVSPETTEVVGEAAEPAIAEAIEVGAD